MTLERVLEPEVMDSTAEASDYNSMDHSQVNRAFVSDLLQAGPIEGDVLDLGTGTALIPIEFCERVEDIRVMAVDMAVSMLELARYNIEVNGLIDRIQLDRVDGKQLPYEDEMFWLTMSNSIVHHIPDPITVLREAVRVTSGDGRLFFRDLLRPESDERVKELVHQYAGNDSADQKKMFEDSLRAALSLDEIRALVTQLGFDPTGVTATSDRHWTWVAFSRARGWRWLKTSRNCRTMP